MSRGKYFKPNSSVLVAKHNSATFSNGLFWFIGVFLRKSGDLNEVVFSGKSFSLGDDEVFALHKKRLIYLMSVKDKIKYRSDLEYHRYKMLPK